MKLLLIRHGETVDNVAQVYAGSRDSELTNHGFQQATRLGRHLHATGHRFSHVFSSHLQRAVRTAELIVEAQISTDLADTDNILQVKRLPILMEQDFGFYEGKKFYQRPPGAGTTGKQAHRDELVNTPGFVDMESKESMAQRMDAFLDQHLVPLLDDPSLGDDRSVAVVSHGIVLSVLWRRLLLRLPPKSVSPRLQVLESSRGFQLEHLGGWSNTGYLELLMRKPSDISTPALPVQSAAPGEAVSSSEAASVVLVQQDGVEDDHTVPANEPSLPTWSDTSLKDVSRPPTVPKVLHGWTATIETVNGKIHLQGLKRTGGGVGSAKYNAGQKSIDTFFKKRRVG